MANADSSTKCQEVAVTLSEAAAVAEKVDLEPNLPNDEKIQPNEIVEPAEAANSDEKEIKKDNVGDNQDTEDTEILQDDEVATQEAEKKKADETDDTETVPIATKRSVEKKVDNDEIILSKKLKTDSQQKKPNDGIACEE